MEDNQKTAPQQWVVVHFLHESLGEDRVRVYGPYESEYAANKYAHHTRADRAVKVVQLED